MLGRLLQLKQQIIRPASSVLAQSIHFQARMARRKDGLISTAGCIIIGDEVLGGKTHDTNSNYFAKYCFDHGISLKRIEVIPDEEDDIIETVRRMSSNYDFVITSGGIGPTIAKAFSLPLTLHDEAFTRMKRLSKSHPRQQNFDWDTPSEALTAKKRMIELPLDTSKPLDSQVIFPCEDLWVPICIVNGNVHILPGVPRLFTQLLTGYEPTLKTKLASPGGQDYRVIISTPMPESEAAAYLTKIATEVKGKGVKVGSYPRWGKKRNTVTLVGKDKEFIESIVPEVVRMVDGKVVSKEDEQDSDGEKGDSGEEKETPFSQ